MTNPLYTISQLPSSSQAAIRAFDERYLAVLSGTQPTAWTDLGDVVDTDSPMITFPISALSLKYQQTEGESKSKTRGELSFDLKVEEFDEGVEARLIDLYTKVFAYRAWTSSPAQLVEAEARFRNLQIAALLEAGHTTTIWDGQNFFDDAHPANPFDSSLGTFDNYQASTKDVVSLTNIEAEVTLMKEVLDMNGRPMGVQPDTILVPRAKSEALRNLMKQDVVGQVYGSNTAAAGVRNPYFGIFNIVEVPELTDVNDWYLVDSKMMSRLGMAPWLMARYRAPNSLGLRVYDESSDFFKDTGRIKISSHIWYGFALAFPHCIRLVKGA